MPPSPYAIRMRPVFITSLVLLMSVVVGKFIISDYWGAISLIFVFLMGVLVLSGDAGINATNALFYAVMAMISGVFDVISCMLYFQHSKYKLFEEKAPTLAIVAQSIFIISPIALFISSALSYSIFSDCRTHSEEFMPMVGDFEGYPYGGTATQGQRSQGASRQGPGGVVPNTNQPFVPFQGQPRTLAM